ncbi:MAG: EF-hand domain-containing protein, partial [Akkermansiaceae bacterium]
LDRDKDGKLQEQELRPREPKWLTTVRKNFQKHDLDSSGALEPKEFGEALKNLEEKIQPERLFKKLDKNRDHKLQKNEFRWQHADSKPPRHSPLLDMDIKKHDKNGSGGLDFAEFAKLPFIGRIPEERRKGFFNRLDSDGNGEVSPREIKRAHQKLRRERPPHIKPPSGDHRPPEQGRKKGRGGPPPKRGHGPPSKPPHPVPPEARL